MVAPPAPTNSWRWLSNEALAHYLTKYRAMSRRTSGDYIEEDGEFLAVLIDEAEQETNRRRGASRQVKERLRR